MLNEFIRLFGVAMIAFLMFIVAIVATKKNLRPALRQHLPRQPCPSILVQNGFGQRRDTGLFSEGRDTMSDHQPTQVQFDKDMANCVMQVLRDDRLYRHMRFRKLGGGFV